MFTEYSSEVVGFTSTWKEGSAGELKSSYAETDPLPPKQSVGCSTNKCQDIGVQTSYETPLSLNKTDELSLAKWLTKIYPFVERELKKGPTKVFEFNDNSCEANLTGHVTQILSFNTNCKEGDVKKANELAFGTAAWMSICIDNAPILVISAAPVHNSWCDHSDTEVQFFKPKRFKDEIIYDEFKTMPVKTCVQVLSTNTFNKDIIAAGTISGDIYIWLYEITNDGGQISELLTDTSYNSCIVDITWMKTRNNSQEVEMLVCHKDGHVVLWKIAKQIVRDKIHFIHSGSSSFNLTAIAAISSTEYTIGTDSGKLFHCSIPQATHIQEKQNTFDPVIGELTSHKFAVSSLFRKTSKTNPLIISSDVSGEVYFHPIDELSNQPENVIKIPLPFKTKIVLSADDQHILTTGLSGSLEIYTISSTSQKRIQGNERDMGNMIAISDNGSWIITGCYSGDFQLFRLQSDY